jgi:hypothetical protein
MQDTLSSTKPSASDNSALFPTGLRGPVTGRAHQASINNGEGHITFCSNGLGYYALVDFYVPGLYANGHKRCAPVFDMERCLPDVENLQAADPSCTRYTDSVLVDGCALTTFALHGESVEAVKAALAKVWMIDGLTGRESRTQ